MDKCAECGRTDDFFFQCNGCDQWFCPDHLSEPDHDCPAATSATTAEPTDSAGEPVSEVQSDTTAQERPGETVEETSFLDVFRHPKIRLALIGLIIFSLLVGIGVASVATNFGQNLFAPSGQADQPDGAAKPLNETELEQLIAADINDERTNAGEAQLEVNATLTTIASYHSDDMATNNYTAHKSPDGETVIERFQRFNYSCGMVGELVLHTFYDTSVQLGDGTVEFQNESQLASGIVQAWMHSPSRQAVLLNESWTQVGVGVAITDSDKVYVTVNFCEN